MITLISPAKTLDFTQEEIFDNTQPRLLEDSLRLVDVLKKKTSKKLQTMMSVSKNIADLNVQRFQDFSTEFTQDNSKIAIQAFKGDVYLGLEASTFSKEEMDFAQ